MARPSLQAVGESAVSSFQRMTGPQRLTLGLAFAATAIGLFLVARVTSSTPMATLYTNLEPEVAAEVTSALDARGVAYQLEGAGRIVEVPADQVHELRLDLAAENLPTGQDGYGLLEGLSVTSSVIQQEMVIRRALEGELARTIAAIDTVRSASVLLVMPENDLIVDDGRHAKGSVMVDTGGQSLDAMQVQAVVNLVASSVEGLSNDQVTVIDETGRVLAAPGGDATLLDLEGDSRLRARMSYEQDLQADLENLLADIVGPGLSTVVVSAELDFDTVTTTSEERRPLESADGEQLLVNEQTREEFYRDDEPATEEGGELEIELPEDIDVDGDELIDEGVKYVLDERDAEYAFNTLVTTSQNAPGQVTSLSVAVKIDENAVDAAVLPDLEGLIGAAVGLNADRGDTLAVSLLPTPENLVQEIEDAANPPEVTGGGLDLVSLIRTIGTVIVALLVIVFALRYLARGNRREVLVAATVEDDDTKSLEAGEAAAELEAGEAADGEEGEDGEDADSAEAAEDEDESDDDEEEEDVEPPEERLQHLIANQTDDVAGVLRSWLNEEVEDSVGV